MKFGGRIGVLVVGSTVLLLAPPVLAQERQVATCPAVHNDMADEAFAGFADGLPRAPCSEPSLPPSSVPPLKSGKRTDYAAPAGPPLVADQHVVSTELGFEQGVGPAPGRAVTYHGQKYRVVDIKVKDGGPSFTGGSAFVVGVNGSTLMVGLKSIIPGSSLDPDRLEASVVN
jgi:hypothetical protein